MNADVDAGAAGTGGSEVPVEGAVDTPKPKDEPDDVAGAAPNAGALLVADVVELWPNVKPVDAVGAVVAGVEVAGAGLAVEAPKENAGPFDSVVACPKPALGFVAEVEVVEDDPNVNPVVSGVVSFGFDSAGLSVEAAQKLKDGAAVSFGLSVVVELFDPPNENDGVGELTPALFFAGTWGGFDTPPKEKAGLDATGFEPVVIDDGAIRFLGRSESSFGLVCFGSGEAPKLKAGALAFGASVVAVAVVPKLNNDVESFLSSPSS